MKSDNVDSIVAALRKALAAYGALEPGSPKRAVVAQRLFGVPAVPLLLPQLDEIARNVRQ